MHYAKQICCTRWTTSSINNIKQPEEKERNDAEEENLAVKVEI